MAGKEKFIVAGGEKRSKKDAEEKGKRARFRTREAMDFDPKTSVLLSQKEVDAYKVKYNVRLPLNV